MSLVSLADVVQLLPTRQLRVRSRLLDRWLWPSRQCQEFEYRVSQGLRRWPLQFCQRPGLPPGGATSLLLTRFARWDLRFRVPQCRVRIHERAQTWKDIYVQD